ncbi:MAG TPA: hypothetical protein VG866_00045 [Candidatus Paceibacterota bacterium]|nr:hypothetical protein [Candidatus Paceibacterota bacterium]
MRKFITAAIIGLLAVGCSVEKSRNPTGPSPVDEPTTTSTPAPTPQPPTPTPDPAPNPSPNPPTPTPVDPTPAPNPDPTPDPAPPSPNPQPPPPPAPPTPQATTNCDFVWAAANYTASDQGRTLTVTINNPSKTCTNDYVVGVFYMPVPGVVGFKDQVFLEAGHVQIGPGQTKSVTVHGPTDCAKPWQLDVYFGITMADIGDHGKNIHPYTAPKPFLLVNYWFGTTDACTPPPPPPPTCSTIGLKLSNIGITAVNGSTPVNVTAMFTPTFTGPGPTTVNWGDGTTGSVASGVQQSHAYPRNAAADKTYTVTVSDSQITPACVQTFTVLVPKLPPPPTCSDLHPFQFDWSGSVVEHGDHGGYGASTFKKKSVDVTVNYTYQNVSGQFVGIYWQGSDGLKWVKIANPLKAKCEDGPKTGKLEWSSDNPAHLPSNGAKYFIIRFTNGDYNNPDIIPGSKEPIPVQ